MIEKKSRRSIRLPHYDYRQNGIYFITVCTFQRACLFGDISNGEMQLNYHGKIVNECWQEIPLHFPYAALDLSVVMPNHFHGILNINNSIKTVLPDKYKSQQKVLPQSLSAIIRSFKAAVTKKIRGHGVGAQHAAPMQIWQRNYYEHVVRNDEVLYQLQEYVQNNPLQWELDDLNPHKIRNELSNR